MIKYKTLPHNNKLKNETISLMLKTLNMLGKICVKHYTYLHVCIMLIFLLQEINSKREKETKNCVCLSFGYADSLNYVISVFQSFSNGILCCYFFFSPSQKTIFIMKWKQWTIW